MSVIIISAVSTLQENCLWHSVSELKIKLYYIRIIFCKVLWPDKAPPFRNGCNKLFLVTAPNTEKKRTIKLIICGTTVEKKIYIYKPNRYYSLSVLKYWAGFCKINHFLAVGNRSCPESKIEFFESLLKKTRKNPKALSQQILYFLEHSQLTPAVLNEASIVKIESPNKKYQNTCFRNNLRIKLKNYLKMNRVCLFAMLMKCTKFDKHACESFLYILSIRKK